MEQDIDEVLRCYRVLGLSVYSPIDTIEQRRRELVQRFHPDKHPFGWELDTLSPTERTQHIEEAYRFIQEHHDAIKTYFGILEEQVLTTKAHTVGARSHLMYSVVAQYIEA